MKNSSVLKLAHEDSRSQDRISALPDEILCHILSFLIPLHSVRTTVLAKRWNNLWTACVSNLDFNMANFRSYQSVFISRSNDNHDNFIRFVDRVLALRDSSLDIRRFCVRWWQCPREYFPDLYRWIQTAVDANLVELDVSLSMFCDCGYCEDELRCVRPFEMPPSVLTCKSLVSLKVKGHLSYSLPDETGCFFPNLKFLHYSSRYNSGRATRENLFRSCPKLEELTIKQHHNKHVLGFKISAPELRELTTIVKEGYDDDKDEDECDQRNCAGCDAEAWYPCTFSIDAPKLEKLCVAGEVMSNYTWENSSSLVQAEVQLQGLQDGSSDDAHDLLRNSNLSSVRYMIISTPDFQPLLDLTFGNLIKLEMVLCKKFCWAWLKKMLKKSPNLESLVIKFTFLESPGCFDSNDFYPPKSEPTCLTSVLKTVFLKEFTGTEDEINVVEYLLRYGEVLDKLIVSSSRHCTDDAKEKIISFEKGSRTCQVDFI